MNERTVRIAELEAEQVDLLPSREAMSGINITNIIGINTAVAISVFGDSDARTWQHLVSYQG
jgi:hypothetical protein